jgi:5-methylcytosine-specific restriction endonuclease McrA
LAPQRFAVQFTIGQSAHDKLVHAQALLSHQLPSGDIAAVFERALDALIRQLEKGKFAASQTPRAARPCSGGPRPTAGSRYIPAHVRRGVWQRDGGQCTFVSEAGHRCPARARLEFDHVHEVARGGEASVAGIRLRCQAHNQYGAERTFGAEFMRHKRRAAAEMRSAAQVPAATRARTHATVEAVAAERASDRDVVPWLRQLGFSAAEARRAAALCEDIPDASLEERVRRALSRFPVKGRTIRPVEASETVTRGHESRAPAAC